MSYEDLLEIMKKRYFEICGHYVSEASETGIRLRVLADAIVKFKDKLTLEQKDTNLLTAIGKALDEFGKDLNFTRDSKKSTGMIRIFKAEGIEDELIIPKGIWLTLPGAYDLRFGTIE
ncbi:MAG: hypothetical protein ACI4PK_00700 [Oscillospiraceae bacterium]